MRAELGGFVADGVLAVAGLGVLWGLGMVDRTARSLLSALGLAYLVGTAVVCLLLIALLTVGVPLGLVSFAIVAGLCVLAGVIVRARRTGERPRLRRLRRPDVARPALRGRSADWWIVACLVVALGAYTLGGLVNAMVLPLDQHDAWSIWTRKAQMLTVGGTLDRNFFANESYSFMHPDYPLLFPVWEAIHFRAAGTLDTQAVHAHVWLLLPAFAAAAARLVSDSVRPAIWAPIVLGLVVAPGVWRHLLSAYADVPMSMFLGLGALSLGLWLSRGSRAHLALAAILLAGAASTKNEGLLGAIAILGVAGLIVLVTERRALIAYGTAAGAVVAAILPWRLWMAGNGIAGDLSFSDGLNPAYLAERSDRLGASVKSVNDQLALQGEWLYLVPLALLVVAVSLIAGVNRRSAMLYLGSGLAIWVSLVWVLVIYPLDLTFLIQTASDRVVIGLIFVSAAAVLHLTGGLAAAALRPPADDRV